MKTLGDRLNEAARGKFIDSKRNKTYSVRSIGYPNGIFMDIIYEDGIRDYLRIDCHLNDNEVNDDEVKKGFYSSFLKLFSSLKGIFSYKKPRLKPDKNSEKIGYGCPQLRKVQSQRQAKCTEEKEPSHVFYGNDTNSLKKAQQD